LAIATVWFAFKITVFSSLPESEIKFWVRIAEIIVFVSAALLVAGLTGEWSENESWKKSFLYKAAKGAVIMGVCGELLGDAGIFEGDHRLQEAEGTAIEIAMTHATVAETLANDLFTQNMDLRARLSQLGVTVDSMVITASGRKVGEDDAKLIKRQLRGDHRPLTVALLSDPEPRSYGVKIGLALEAAGFAVSYDNLSGPAPPDTGVVFCEIQASDRQTYEVLRQAHVATRYVSLADHRPDFCDIPGVEGPIESLIGGITFGLVTPQRVGRLIPRGSLGGQRGPRIFVGQKQE